MKFTDLAKLEEKWSDRGLAVIGVHRQDSSILSLYFWRKNQNFYPLFLRSAKFEHERNDDNVRHAVKRLKVLIHMR